MSQKALDNLRRQAQEFVTLTNDGDFSDIAVLNRYSQLSAYLAIAVGPLLDEIERLSAEREDGGRPRISTWAKLDGRHGGSA